MKKSLNWIYAGNTELEDELFSLSWKEKNNTILVLLIVYNDIKL